MLAIEMWSELKCLTYNFFCDKGSPAFYGTAKSITYYLSVEQHLYV